MSKKWRILICIIAIIILVIGIIAFDLFKVRERLNTKAEYVSERTIDAYSLQNLGNKVILTTYTDGPILRTVRVYNFSNGKMINCEDTYYYKSKILAMLSENDVGETNLQVILKGNTIHSKPVISVTEYGKTREEIVGSIEEAYSKISVKIGE